MNKLIERTTPWLNNALLFAAFVCATVGIFWGANLVGCFNLLIAIFALEARRL